MKKIKCQYCHNNMAKVEDNFYCDHCESSYAIKDGQQIFTNVTIEDTNQITMHQKLCQKCEKYYAKNLFIKCKTFKEYIKKLKFCKKCKEDNEKCIKNSFYRNFLLYKSKERGFGLFFILVYCLLFFLLDENMIIMLIWQMYIDWSMDGFRLFSILFKLITFFLCSHTSYFKYFVLLYNVYHFFTYKVLYFKVPVNLENGSDLSKHLNELSI